MVQSSSVPWWTGSSGGHEGWFSWGPLPVFSAGDPCERFWQGQICPLFDVVHPAFPLPTTLQGALKDVLERLLWRVTCPNHASFPVLTAARRGSHGPTRQLILLCTSRWSCAPNRRYREVSSAKRTKLQNALYIILNVLSRFAVSTLSLADTGKWLCLSRLFAFYFFQLQRLKTKCSLLLQVITRCT